MKSFFSITEMTNLHKQCGTLSPCHQLDGSRPPPRSIESSSMMPRDVALRVPAITEKYQYGSKQWREQCQKRRKLHSVQSVRAEGIKEYRQKQITRRNVSAAQTLLSLHTTVHSSVYKGKGVHTTDKDALLLGIRVTARPLWPFTFWGLGGPSAF